MAKKRYSRQELYVLRNHIPVNGLIKDLGIPFKTSEGGLRFCCPLCRGFDTGVKSATNLARCFYCEKNYNTIDLVMLVKGLDFTGSVKFLKSVYETNNPMPSSVLLPNKRAGSQPESISDILKTIIPESSPTTKAPTESSSSQLTIEILNDRVFQLECQVSCLTQKIKAIEQNR